MSRIFRFISAAFFPEHCPYCGIPVKVDEPACAECKKQFPKTINEGFAMGGYPFAAPFSYTGIFANAVKSFKFRQRVDCTEKLAKQIAAAVNEAYKDISFDIITCVPMYKKQIKARGYNQSKLLAVKLSKISGIPYKDLLIKHKENEPQHSLLRRQRRKNVKGVYQALNTGIIKGHNILVIDDIITTGYTLGECCRILTKAGAKKICCAAICAKNTT